MGKLVRSACLALIVTATASCATDVANRYYADKRYPATTLESVEVLTAPPSRPYVVIADFQARNASVKSMRRQAAKIGADAIIVSGLGGYVSVHSEWADDRDYPRHAARVFATAIKY